MMAVVEAPRLYIPDPRHPKPEPKPQSLSKISCRRRDGLQSSCRISVLPSEAPSAAARRHMQMIEHAGKVVGFDRMSPASSAETKERSPSSL